MIPLFETKTLLCITKQKSSLSQLNSQLYEKLKPLAHNQVFNFILGLN